MDKKSVYLFKLVVIFIASIGLYALLTWVIDELGGHRTSVADYWLSSVTFAVGWTAWITYKWWKQGKFK